MESVVNGKIIHFTMFTADVIPYKMWCHHMDCSLQARHAREKERARFCGLSSSADDQLHAIHALYWLRTQRLTFLDTCELCRCCRIQY